MRQTTLFPLSPKFTTGLPRCSTCMLTYYSGALTGHYPVIIEGKKCTSYTCDQCSGVFYQEGC